MEQHSGDFSVTVRDVRQLTLPESDLLTLLWVLEGSVNLAVAEGASQPTGWRSLTATVAGACAAPGLTP